MGEPIPLVDHFDLAESGQWQVVAHTVSSMLIYPIGRCLASPSQIHSLGASEVSLLTNTAGFHIEQEFASQIPPSPE